MTPNTSIAATTATTNDIEARTRIRAKHAEVQKAEKEEQRSVTYANHCRTVAQQHRIELGRLLLQERPRWPKRGPNAKGWGDFLRQVGIPEQSAREWIDLVEAIEISKPNDSGLEMTRADVRAILQAAKQGREEHDEPNAATLAETDIHKRPRTFKRSEAPIELDAKRCAWHVSRVLLARLDPLDEVDETIEVGELERELTNQGDAVTWDLFSLRDQTDVGQRYARRLREIADALDTLLAKAAAAALKGNAA